MLEEEKTLHVLEKTLHVLTTPMTDVIAHFYKGYNVYDFNLILRYFLKSNKIYRVSINYRFNLKNSKKFNFLRCFYLVCFIVKRNT